MFVPLEHNFNFLLAFYIYFFKLSIGFCSYYQQMFLL